MDKKIINTHKHKGDIDKYGNIIDWETDGFTNDFQDDYKEANNLVKNEQEKNNKNTENKDIA